MENKEKPITGYLIDPYTATVNQVAIKDERQNIYNTIGSEYIESIPLFRDNIYVDEEGLLTATEETKYFTYAGHRFAGRGLVLRNDRQGNNISPKLSLEAVRSIIKFN